MNKKTKAITLWEMYGLGLIARNPKGMHPAQITSHLGSEAKKIADAIITPKQASKPAKSAAKELLNLAGDS
jgi:hypothetical protein